jgi:hypothetical protein
MPKTSLENPMFTQALALLSSLSFSWISHHFALLLLLPLRRLLVQFVQILDLLVSCQQILGFHHHQKISNWKLVELILIVVKLNFDLKLYFILVAS